VDLGANHHQQQHQRQRRGVVVAHLPAGALVEGRLPGCYPLLSFRAALLRREGEGGPIGAAAGQSEGEEGSPLLSSSHSRRQSVTAQSVCDDREREVIGLASGLGVTGTLLLLILLLLLPSLLCVCRPYVCVLRVSCVSCVSGIARPGALLVCTLLGCIAIVGFQQYRLRNIVAGTRPPARALLEA
jgi:hypothetical protein